MRPRSFALSLLSVAALALALRIWDLGGESLWVDEIYHAHAASLPSWKEMLDYDLGFKKLYTPLNDSLNRLFGLDRTDTEFWWRLPSAIFGAISVFFFGLAVRRMYSPALGLAAAMALALAPFHVTKASQEVNVYSLQVLFCVATVLAFVRAEEKGGAGRWIVVWACATFALYAQTLSIFLLFWMGVWALLLGGWQAIAGGERKASSLRPALRKMAAAAAALFGALGVFVVWFLPVGLPGLRQQTGGNWPDPTFSSMIEVLSPMAGGQGPSAAAFLALCVLGALSLPLRRSKWTIFIHGWLLAALPILAAGWLRESRIAPQYLLPMFPALCLYAAHGALVIGRAAQTLVLRARPSMSKRPELLPLAMSAVLLLGVTAGPLWTSYTTTSKEAWRQMAQHLSGRVGENDIVVCSPPWSLFCMEYYQARLPKPLSLWNWDVLLTAPAEAVARLRAERGEIWYVGNGGLPKKPGIEGKGFYGYCVYRYPGATTQDADFQTVANELAGGAGNSNLVTKQIAVAHQRKGEHEQVIELLEEHLKKPISGTLVDTWGVLAESYAATGQAAKAAEAYKKLAAAQKGNDRAYTLYKAASVYLQHGDIAHAFADAQALEQEFPEYVLLQYLLGRCYEARGESEKAYACFIRNLELKPNDAYAYNCCGAYHLKFGKHAEAEKVFLRGLEIDPTSYPEMYGWLARTYHDQGKIAETEAILRKGIEATWNPSLVLTLAEVLQGKGEHVKRVELLEEGLKRHPEDQGLKKALGNA